MKIQAKSNAGNTGAVYSAKVKGNTKLRPGSLAAIVAGAKIARAKGLAEAIKVAR